MPVVKTKSERGKRRFNKIVLCILSDAEEKTAQLKFEGPSSSSKRKAITKKTAEIIAKLTIFRFFNIIIFVLYTKDFFRQMKITVL